MSVVAQRFEPMITFEQIMTQVKQLSLDQRLRLIQFTAQTLMVPSPKNTSQPLPYGKFSGGQQSTLEDFCLLPSVAFPKSWCYTSTKIQLHSLTPRVKLRP